MQARETGSTLQVAMEDRQRQETGIEDLNPMEVAAKRQSKALKEILASPMSFVEVTLFGLAVTLSPMSPHAIALYLGEGEIGSSKVAELGEIVRYGRCSEFLPFLSEDIGGLSSLMWLSTLFFLVLDLAKYWLCILAIFLFYNSDRYRPGLWLLLPIIAYFILITGPLGPEATFRYRVPIDPYISLVAGAGLCGLLRTWVGFRDPRLLLSVFGFLVFCGIVGTLRLFFSVSMV
jgi:hypothetical protein